MKKNPLIALGLLGLFGCATPAVVFVSPHYKSQHIMRVAVMGFSDFPGQQGSGTMIADIFEKYLFKLNYQVVDANQVQQVLQQQPSAVPSGTTPEELATLNKNLNVDAIVTGSISELQETSEQTVMVDIPQEETSPVYQDVVVQGRHGGLRTVTEQTGTQTTYTDQSVPETETLPARVGFSVRLVSVKTGELMWSGSGSADGMNMASAAEAAATKIIQAIQKDLVGPER